MNTCQKCKAENPDGDNYCGQCGFQLTNFGAPVGLTQHELKAKDIRLNLGIVYLKMGKLEQAMQIAEDLLEQDSNDAQAIELQKDIGKLQESLSVEKVSNE